MEKVKLEELKPGDRFYNVGYSVLMEILPSPAGSARLVREVIPSGLGHTRLLHPELVVSPNGETVDRMRRDSDVDGDEYIRTFLSNQDRIGGDPDGFKVG